VSNGVPKYIPLKINRGEGYHNQPLFGTRTVPKQNQTYQNVKWSNAKGIKIWRNELTLYQIAEYVIDTK